MFENLSHASLGEWGVFIFCWFVMLWGVLVIILKATGKTYNITPFPPKKKSMIEIATELEQIMGKDLFKKTTSMIQKSLYHKSFQERWSVESIKKAYGRAYAKLSREDLIILGIDPAMPGGEQSGCTCIQNGKIYPYSRNIGK